MQSVMMMIKEMGTVLKEGVEMLHLMVEIMAVDDLLVHITEIGVALIMDMDLYQIPDLREGIVLTMAEMEAQPMIDITVARLPHHAIVHHLNVNAPHLCAHHHLCAIAHPLCEAAHLCVITQHLHANAHLQCAIGHPPWEITRLLGIIAHPLFVIIGLLLHGIDPDLDKRLFGSNGVACSLKC